MTYTKGFDMTDTERRIAFIRDAGRLKDVLRSAWTAEGRKESTAEHTWRLCLLAMTFEDRLGSVDFAKLLKICVLHDLGEAIGGDIPAVRQHEVPDKADRERADLLQLMQPLPSHLRAQFLALWEEYEEATSPEARAVKALDKMETIIQHNQGANPPGFDYDFNLSYGAKQTSVDPLFLEIRAVIDEETRRRSAESKE